MRTAFGDDDSGSFRQKPDVDAIGIDRLTVDVDHIRFFQFYRELGITQMCDIAGHIIRMAGSILAEQKSQQRSLQLKKLP